MAQRQQDLVSVVALKPTPYYRIRPVDAMFDVTRGYADLFVRQGLVRLATPADRGSGSPVANTRALETTREPRAKRPTSTTTRKRSRRRTES